MDKQQTYQEKLEEAIVNMLIDALEKKEIDEDTMSTVSAYVLDHVSSVTDNKSAIIFLEDLVSQWKMFEQLLTIEKAQLQEQVEDEVADGVLLLLQHGKLESAIKLAKSVTNTPNQPIQ
jgi:hypothetical protein